MSFEGYYQYIGQCGHSWTVNAGVMAYGDSQEVQDALKCPCCKQPPKFWNLVDVTNGSGPEYGERSMEAPMKEVGFTDTWTQDHHGNRYAIKHPLYEPVGNRWRREDDGEGASDGATNQETSNV